MPRCLPFRACLRLSIKCGRRLKLGLGCRIVVGLPRRLPPLKRFFCSHPLQLCQGGRLRRCRLPLCALGLGLGGFGCHRLRPACGNGQCLLIRPGRRLVQRAGLTILCPVPVAGGLPVDLVASCHPGLGLRPGGSFRCRRLCLCFLCRCLSLFRCLAGCFLFRRRLGSLVVSGRCRKLGGSGGIPCRVVFLPRAPKRRCRCLERGLCCRPVLFCESLRLGRLGLGSGVYDRFLRHCR